MKLKRVMTASKLKIAVIGAGSWGTALAILLARNGHRVVLWGHKAAHMALLAKERENSKFLAGVHFPENLELQDNLSDTVNKAAVVVMVVPSHGYRAVFSTLAPFLSENCRVVSAVKGIENSSLMTMTQIMEEVLADSSDSRGIEVGVLSGPSFAKEVANAMPTAVTLGFREISVAKELQAVFASKYFRVYASEDVIGLEMSAALKNIIAIATGVCDGLGYGLNTRAALITRGLAEIQRLGMKLGADAATFSGLSGMGDLLLTCTGSLSRNRTVGIKLGEGKSIEQIKDQMNMVAEGIKTTRSVYDLARNMDIEMPILEQVYNILYRGKDCAAAVHDLLDRELRVE
jgi:glycerol-3-phosphate dehydrogenase (NAD(P)+)